MTPIKWRPNRRVTFNKWKDCPRCSLPWPESALRREPETGSVVCPECFDGPSHADRMAKGELPETREKVWEPD